MLFLHTATGAFDRNNAKEGMSWESYIEWSKLKHLTELVSLDVMVNEIVVRPDFDDAEDWECVHVFNNHITGFYTTLDFVFKRLTAKRKFNLLTVVFEPDQDCKTINVDGYEFMGYELLDQHFSNSVLSNCGGFDETFLPTDLNDKGLIDDFEKAYNIKKRLLINNPDNHHAKTYVIAIWRHKTIGDKRKN